MGWTGLRVQRSSAIKDGMACKQRGRQSCVTGAAALTRSWEDSAGVMHAHKDGTKEWSKGVATRLR